MATLLIVTTFIGGCARGLSDKEKEAVAAMDRAHNLMGGTELIDSIHTLQIGASSVGPRGPFLTQISGRTNGDIHFKEIYPKWGDRLGGIVGNQYWRQEVGGGIERLDRQRAVGMRNRDFHRLIINMDRRFSKIESAGPAEFFGVAALKLEMIDDLGFPASAYFSESIGLPLGIEMTDPVHPDGEPMTVTFAKWQKVGDVVLFKQATFKENDYEFRFDYYSIRVNPEIDSLLIFPIATATTPED